MLDPEPTDLTIRHTFQTGTLLLGTDQGDRTGAILRALRLGWTWSNDVPAPRPERGTYAAPATARHAPTPSPRPPKHYAPQADR